MKDFLDMMNDTAFQIDLLEMKYIEENGFEPRHLGFSEKIADEARKYFQNCCEILGLEEFKSQFTQEEAELLRFNRIVVNDKCIIESDKECLLEQKANEKEVKSLQEKFDQVNVIYNTGMVNSSLGRIINSELEKEKKDRK